jgi:hypothetical protein
MTRPEDDFRIRSGMTPAEKLRYNITTFFTIVIAGGLVWLLIWWISGGFSGPAQPKSISATDAQVACQTQVEKQLKAPASADYPADIDPVKTGDGWQWNAYVDAQNSFGAKLRTNFTCEVVGTDPSTAQIRVNLQ